MVMVMVDEHGYGLWWMSMGMVMVDEHGYGYGG